MGHESESRNWLEKKSDVGFGCYLKEAQDDMHKGGHKILKTLWA